MCVRPSVLLQMIARVPPGPGPQRRYVYAGWHEFKRAGYDIQKGEDGSFVPYFSGWVNFLSARLIRDVLNLVTDPPLAYYHLEARCGEDCLMGRWVRRTEIEHNATALRLEDERIKTKLEEGSKGHCDANKAARTRRERRGG